MSSNIIYTVDNSGLRTSANFTGYFDKDSTEDCIYLHLENIPENVVIARKTRLHYSDGEMIIGQDYEVTLLPGGPSFVVVKKV